MLRPPYRTARNAIALLLTLTVGIATAQGIAAEELVARYRQRLEAADPGGQVRSSLTAGERAKRLLQPRLRLDQDASWGYGGSFDLGLGASLTVPVEDPEAAARVAVAEKRLALARHNVAAEVSFRIHEFRRSLRILVHLGEVQSLLEQGRRDLEQLRESRWTVEPALDKAFQIRLLELDQALTRARGERTLQAISLAQPLDLEPDRLLRVDIHGSFIPQLFGSGGTLQSFDCPVVTDETARARLVLEETLLSIAEERASRKTRVMLDGNMRVAYAGGTALASSPWQLQGGLGLSVELPAFQGASPDLNLNVDEYGVRQSSSLAIGAADSDSGAWREDDAREVYRESLRQAQLAAGRARLNLEDAQGSVELKRLELAQIPPPDASMEGSPVSGLINAVDRRFERLQAELALLGATLDRDLAALELLRACGSEVGSRNGA